MSDERVALIFFLSLVPGVRRWCHETQSPGALAIDAESSALESNVEAGVIQAGANTHQTSVR